MILKAEAIEILATLDEGKTTTLQLVDEFLAQCERHNDLNAFVFLDPTGTCDAARRSDAARKGGRIGPLHGLPIVVKDNIDNAFIPTTGGTPALRGHRPDTNALIVQRLVDAGVIILDKTNMDELAYGATNNNFAYGPVRNPYDPTRISGGSSSGTAVAAAARMAPVGLGTDTGGSARIPASFCGVVGFRPSIGRYPMSGIIPFSHARDTAGLITRSVPDAALLDAVITQADSVLDPVDLKEIRIGVPRDDFFDDLDPDMAATLASILALLAEMGVTSVEKDIPNLVGHLSNCQSISFFEFRKNLAEYLAQHGLAMDVESVVRQIETKEAREVLGKSICEGEIPVERPTGQP